MGKKTQDRATRILHLLLQRGKLSVDDLAVEVETSAASVRRDLTKLEQRGLVNRTHGAVELAGKMTYEPFRFDAAFPQREERFADEKRRIALAAAALVEEGHTIALAPGTNDHAGGAQSAAPQRHSYCDERGEYWHGAFQPAVAASDADGRLGAVARRVFDGRQDGLRVAGATLL